MASTPAARRLALFAAAAAGTALIGALPTPAGLSAAGQYALATLFFAAFLWVTGALPLAVTALTIPVLLTALGVYGDMEPALAGFADPLIFLFIAGFMLANALQKYGIDRRIALRLLAVMGSSPRLLVLAVMLATAFLSMWVSNTATTAMMVPIAVGILAQVVGRHGVRTDAEPPHAFTNLQVAMLLGTAYGASIGGVATLIGTPPNTVVAAQLDRLLDYSIGFADWLLIGLPIVLVTLPLAWYLLTYWLYPPGDLDVAGARAEAGRTLAEEGPLEPRGRRVAWIFAVTATLWVLGGLDFLAGDWLPEAARTTLFGGEGANLLGTGNGHQGLLYYVLVGLAAIPALVLADTMEWEDLVPIDWGTILLFGGGICLADAFARTGATEWVAEGFFSALTGAPIVLLVGAVVLLVIFLTEVTSNTATATIIAPLLIGIGGLLAGTLGLSETGAAVFLAVAGGVAASFAFALPVATPPNAVAFGSGYLRQAHMLRAGIVLNLVMTAVLTALLTLMFYHVWPGLLW
ncbi:SLC13 family permease [Thiohalorhabdus denitrificans]|uniref:Solute carrier family 13 (Sodium-dependent dicarboxylate transporter), member 2/3/5 n=1 Tax=Thiohalorhabdus denitrificans TaxID=381306 RepID=A0A1G5FT69_9GAMM|nr:solute carrier family 13 (sodium-dependent dicarboxylate transporter), member 2/3/5 [Thiohalorhabdus denitrificans]